jgi:hypothetical protein
MSMRYQAGIVLPGYNALKVPNAPTIGTATAGGASASVTFTAPADVGGGAITGYSVVSTPGGAIGTGASSPITVSGLTNGTAYTFKVFATNAYGPSPLSAASNSVTPAMQIGDAYAGGFYAGQIGVSSVATYNIVIGPKATAQCGPAGLKWKNSGTDTPGADSVINGPQNTADMVADGSSTVYPAAHFCNDLVTGGYSDWYMPASNELEVCYYNLKPTTQTNNTNSGTNPNAVPARGSNYSSGTPAQTSATAFKSGGSEAFSASAYWSSSKYTPSVNSALNSYFNNGYQGAGYKANSTYVRAIRRVAV